MGEEVPVDSEEGWWRDDGGWRGRVRGELSTAQHGIGDKGSVPAIHIIYMYAVYHAFALKLAFGGANAMPHLAITACKYPLMPCDQ